MKKHTKNKSFEKCWNSYFANNGYFLCFNEQTEYDDNEDLYAGEISFVGDVKRPKIIPLYKQNKDKHGFINPKQKII